MTPVSEPSTPTSGPHLFRALRSRNYRLFFVGQWISLVGTFLTQIATAWLVYRLTGSELLLGTVAFAGQLPLFFLAPFGGVWVDRWNKRRLLVITQILSGLQSLALAACAFTHVHVWEIIALAFIQGLINAFDMPARQAFVLEMVDNREDLPNAIALNSTMVHAARLIGPAMGGFLVQFLGEGWCFTIDGVSYIAVIISLLMMRVKPHVPKPRERGVWEELREGIRYAWDHVPIRVLLLLMAVVSLTGMPALNILMPVFAKELGKTHSGPGTLGLLMAASGAGALVAALRLANKRSVLGLGRLIAVSGLMFGLAAIVFSISRQLWLSILIVPIAGYGMLSTFASANTVLQTLADDDKRGRVMALFTVAFMGMAPFGNLLAGVAAEGLGKGISGASLTVAIAGVIVVIAAGFFAAMLPMLRKIVQPIYVEKGIIREVATGLGNAASVTTAQAELADGGVQMNNGASVAEDVFPLSSPHPSANSPPSDPERH